MTAHVMKVRRFVAGKKSQQGGGPLLTAHPYPSCLVHNVQADILSLACIFQCEGMLSMSEDVGESLGFGKEALVCPKHSPLRAGREGTFNSCSL